MLGFRTNNYNEDIDLKTFYTQLEKPMLHESLNAQDDKELQLLSIQIVRIKMAEMNQTGSLLPNRTNVVSSDHREISDNPKHPFTCLNDLLKINQVQQGKPLFIDFEY